MSKYSTVFLGLGSNQGDKLAWLKLAVKAIHQNIGSVVRISDIYRTKPLGFEGEDFFNAVVVVNTFHSADEVLHSVLHIELELGRVRSTEVRYSSRTIDIDILYFDDDEVNRDHLQIPHPRLHERAFVIKPLLDVLKDFDNLSLYKRVVAYWEAITDKSLSKTQYNIEVPVASWGINHLNYIAIEGNIGAGKTTLSTRLASDCNAKLVLERFADNPFLPKFYEDQSRYAFPLEMSFLADRYQQLTDDLSQFDLFKDFVVADYHIFKSLIFAKVTLGQDEYRLYRTMFDIIYKEMPKPDVYVYLYQSTEQLLENIRKRGRSYEQQIQPEYLEQINQGYLDYIKTQTQLNVCIIDVTDRDFVGNQSDYLWVIDQMKSQSAL